MRKFYPAPRKAPLFFKKVSSFILHRIGAGFGARCGVYRGVIFILVITLSSCMPARLPIYPPIIKPQVPILRRDIIHIVAPGETVWRIARMYDVKTQDIMRANNLRKPRELEMGQRLFIPRAAPLRLVIPLYPSKKWKYIIIHHSATDEGNALRFHSAHYLRGFNKGLGYHFVIDNGTKDKLSGQVEVSPRWLKQEDGAHCKASGMNYKAIGICLVGNFEQEKVMAEQLDSLIYLVNILREYYHIPFKNIMGHSQVPGAKTRCPGRYFPWKEFKIRLNIPLR